MVREGLAWAEKVDGEDGEDGCEFLMRFCEQK